MPKLVIDVSIYIQQKISRHFQMHFYFVEDEVVMQDNHYKLCVLILTNQFYKQLTRAFPDKSKNNITFYVTCIKVFTAHGLPGNQLYEGRQMRHPNVFMFFAKPCNFHLNSESEKIVLTCLYNF